MDGMLLDTCFGQENAYFGCTSFVFDGGYLHNFLDKTPDFLGTSEFQLRLDVEIASSVVV